MLIFDTAMDRLRAGEMIMVTHPDPMKKTDETRYRFSARGGGITPGLWQKLRPHLEPVDGGLFGDIAQTYRLKPEHR